MTSENVSKPPKIRGYHLPLMKYDPATFWFSPVRLVPERFVCYPSKQSDIVKRIELGWTIKYYSSVLLAIKNMSELAKKFCD